jgi:hypothetical protein
MESRLLTPEDLIRITGAKRYSKQSRWFKDQFGIDVPTRNNGSIVMAWATYEGLERRKYGLTPINGDRPRVTLCFD